MAKTKNKTQKKMQNTGMPTNHLLGTERRLKVLMVNEFFPPKVFGGGEISMNLLAKNIAKKGAEIFVLTSFFSGLKKFEETTGGIKILRILKSGNPSSITGNVKRLLELDGSIKKEVIRLHKKINFDVIHFMNTTINSGAEIKKSLGMPLCCTVNSYTIVCPKGDLLKFGKPCDKGCDFKTFRQCLVASAEVGKLKNRFYFSHNPIFAWLLFSRYKKNIECLKKMDYIFSPSNYLKEIMVERGIEKNRIFPTPNIMDLSMFKSVQKKASQSNNKIRILYLGNYVQFKGPQILVRALKGLEEKTGIEYECNFYGTGQMKNTLVSLANSLGVNAKINDKISYSQIPDAYGQHDIIVFPSLWPEPLGRIPLEVMASGKCVIASDIGGIPEIVIHGKTGFLFRPGDADDLREKLAAVISNPELMKKMQKSSKEFVKEFDGRKTTATVMAVYKKISQASKHRIENGTVKK